MIDYFRKTENDTLFYEKYLKDRLPTEILDMHSHMNTPQNVATVPAERIATDWALQAGYKMTVEEANYYASVLFPQQKYSFAAFPFPIAEADLNGNNEYIGMLIEENKIDFGLMVTRPEWSVEDLEKELDVGKFAGFKPYPDLISRSKGSEVSIFDFISRDQLALAERCNKCVLLHLPRAGRLADAKNISELKEISDSFPKLKVIVAHVGRCFNPCFLESAMVELGDYLNKFWYDTAAVANPQVLKLAFTAIDPTKIMFGLDLPIFLWHGKRYWTQDKYINACREPLPWKKDIDDEETQAQYTFYVYEQIKNILDTADDLGLGDEFKRNYFAMNARKFFEGCLRK
ncbi:MAG: amidohydrolase family protein [Oscillospiraceae bacterium]